MLKTVGWLLVLSLPALADIVKLKNGGELEGWIKNNDKDGVVIEHASGVVTIPHSQIESINTYHESKIEVFYDMWNTFRDAKIAEGYCFLIRWCQEHKLEKFIPLLRRALYDVDPGHDVDHKGGGSTPVSNGPGTTEVKPEEKPKTNKGETVHSPKAPKKTANLKITVAPTWVPPLAKILPDGSIVYPQNALPGPTWSFFDDAFSVPYWGIPPKGLEQQRAAEDFARAKKEFSNDGLMNAIRTWRLYERDRDVLLIPPNAGDTKSWRLIYSLAPRTLALAVIQAVRAGEYAPKTPGSTTTSSTPATNPNPAPPPKPAPKQETELKPLAPSTAPNPGTNLTSAIKNKNPSEIATFLTHPDATVRRTAVEALGALKAVEYAWHASGLLGDADKNVRRAAAWALGEMGATDYAPAVSDLLKDEDPAVRQQAARTLARIGGADQIEPLEAALKIEKVNYVAQSMTEALNALKSK